MGFDMNKRENRKQAPYLQEGDVIGLVAPARSISQEAIEMAIEIFESWGFQVALGSNLFGSDKQFSGSDAARAHDMQTMIDNPKVRAIVAARGGYGTARMVDLVNWKPLLLDPKWMVGFSDMTVLHAHLQKNLGLETIHASMPLSFPENAGTDSLESLRKALTGELTGYLLDGHPLNKPGAAAGILCGGNLSVLYSILGSSSDLPFDDKILFLEDLDEYLYHIDRMMLNLTRSGRLKGIRGLILGGFSQMRDNEVPFGKSAEEIIMESCNGLDIPMAFNLPFGHIPRNLALYLGRELSIDVGNQVRMKFLGG